MSQALRELLEAAGVDIAAVQGTLASNERVLWESPRPGWGDPVSTAIEIQCPVQCMESLQEPEQRED